MTDTYVSQFALVSPMAAEADAQINQIANVVIVSEVPPVAGGALVSQFALVCVDREYVIPLHLHGWLIRSIQGFPYYIEEE